MNVFFRSAFRWPPFKRRHIIGAASIAGGLVAHRAESTFMDTQDALRTQRCLHLSVDGSVPRPIRPLGKAEFTNSCASGRVAIFARSTPKEASKGFAFDSRNVEFGLMLELSPRQSLDDCDVFVGAQIPGGMSLTRSTRWVAKILLNFCSALAPVHSSTGGNSGMDQEYAHIVLQWSHQSGLLDRFEVMPISGKFDTLRPGYTYTWEFGSSFVDLNNWQLVNVPVLSSGS